MEKYTYTYTDNGIVTDTESNLMWQQKTPVNTMTWEEALDYCKRLNLGEYTDWRLPTIQELNSLTDYSQHNPAVDIKVFPKTLSSFYWSSTTYSVLTDYAWGVYFSNGSVARGYKPNHYYVRAVRGK